jgi:hypothetical protein
MTINRPHTEILTVPPKSPSLEAGHPASHDGSTGFTAIAQNLYDASGSDSLSLRTVPVRIGK